MLPLLLNPKKMKNLSQKGYLLDRECDEIKVIKTELSVEFAENCHEVDLSGP